MPEPDAEILDELIEEIVSCAYGMPVRPMERVNAMGEAAVPALAQALVRGQDDETRDPLWLIVLLGEIRHPDGVVPLIQQMRRPELDLLALAAVEGLAKIGPPAVPALIGLATTGETFERLYAYAGLGWIRDGRAYAALLDALARDPALDDVVALALADHGRPEAGPALYQAYLSCEPWQRAEFEDALRALRGAAPPAPQWTRDWRLRYRRRPALADGIDLEWVSVSAIGHREGAAAKRPALAIRPLVEILADRPEVEPEVETCEECGAPIEEFTGVPACPQTAVAIACSQLRLLNEAREDGIEDLFDLLDEIEADESEHRDRGEPFRQSARERWRDELGDLEEDQETCRWLIERGIEHVAPAKALLWAEAARLADRYGDPHGLLRPISGPAARGAKVGRNDPCPCGSGRKYKRCCLGKA